MSTIILPEVRYHTEDDAYHYTVDNRPLEDLASRDDALASSIERFRGVDVRGDESVTLTASDKYYQYYRNALTADRTLTLPTTGLYVGLSFHITRYALSSFNLNIVDPLSGKNLTFSAGQRRFAQYVLITETEWGLVSNGTLP